MKKGIISLSFRHPTKNLRYLADALGMPQKHGWVANEPWVTRSGVIMPPRTDHYWNSGFEFSQERGFTDDISKLTELLQQESVNLKELVANGGNVTIYLQLDGTTNNGDNIVAEQLRKIGMLGIDLSIEVFPTPSNTRKFFNKLAWQWTVLRYRILPRIFTKKKSGI